MHDLSAEEQQLYDMVCEFADTVVAPQAYEADRSHELSMDVVAQMGELGLFGLPFPEEVGGQGGDYLVLCLAIEAMKMEHRVTATVAGTVRLEVAVGQQVSRDQPVARVDASAEASAAPNPTTESSGAPHEGARP